MVNDFTHASELRAQKYKKLLEMAVKKSTESVNPKREPFCTLLLTLSQKDSKLVPFCPRFRRSKNPY